MRALGIDFGTVRIGLAVSDPAGGFAFPLRVLPGGATAKLVEEIRAEAEKNKTEAIVMGLPRQADGELSELGRRIVNFARKLERATGLPVHLVDESMSSEAARQELAETGMKAKKMRRVLDAQAAVHILRTWLQQRNT